MTLSVHYRPILFLFFSEYPTLESRYIFFVKKKKKSRALTKIHIVLGKSLEMIFIVYLSTTHGNWKTKTQYYNNGLLCFRDRKFFHPPPAASRMSYNMNPRVHANVPLFCVFLLDCVFTSIYYFFFFLHTFVYTYTTYIILWFIVFTKYSAYFRLLKNVYLYSTTPLAWVFSV